MTGIVEVPFNADGHALIEDRSAAYHQPAQITFSDTLRFLHIASNGRMWFLNNLDKKVSFFPGDSDKVIRKLHGGVLDGTFQYVKRGCYFGIELVEPIEDTP